MDFLGLATLTIMERACDSIRKRHGINFTLDNIPTDDPETYKFLGEGNTMGVFQLEGSGMTKWLVQMKPTGLEHIIAMVALFRPGPMDFIPDYISRMHGESPVEYRHPAMEPIFCDTYGIPLYQEQLMRAAVELAGYTPSEADNLRSAISKKKKEEIEKHHIKFVEGAANKGIPRETGEAIFTDWEEFARYGFNKSHAADYGLLAVHTAFLKLHYPVEYMTALLSVTKHETDKMALYVNDARNMGVEVLPPDVNASGWDFEIEDRPGQDPAIRFGLGAIKNVGQGPVELISKARSQGDAFRDLNDFAGRVDLRAAGKRALESLIKVGALDKFGSRNALLEVLDRIVAVSSSHFRAAEAGQLSLFGAHTGVTESVILPLVPEADRRENSQLGTRAHRHVHGRASAHTLHERDPPRGQSLLRHPERSCARRESPCGRHGDRHSPAPDQDRQDDGLGHARRPDWHAGAGGFPARLGEVPVCPGNRRSDPG